MRRLLLLTSFAGSLAACASILGDFDVDPSLQPDASMTSSGSTSSSSSGDAGDSGTDGSTPEGGPSDYEQPSGLQIATMNSATCATVQYPTVAKKTITYCWGAQGAKYPASALGTVAGNPNVDGFYRPRAIATDVRYLTFSKLFGSGTGEWFVGAGSDSQTSATYAWGQNDFGECAAGTAKETLPNIFKLNGNLLQFDSIFAGPQHGCLIQNSKLFCWGHDDNCELRSGDSTLCNTPTPLDKSVRAVEDEAGNKSGTVGVASEGAGGLDHTCLAIRNAGSGTGADSDDVYCWGSNLSGQINPSGATISTPTAVGVTLKRASGELAAGENHTCAITDAQKVSCWGKNDSGQSNPQNPGGKSGPKEVTGVPGTLSMLRAAGDLSCVVSKVILTPTPSRAFCWGAGPRGRASNEEAMPVAKVAGIQDVTGLALGRAHACAIAKKEGASATDPAHVWCWGFNDFKRVDPRSPIGQQFPQPIEIKFPPEPPN